MNTIQKLVQFLIILFSPLFLFAQTGKVFDGLTMKSSILDSERKYAIYLPPDYETSKRSYPVLYLLHGGGDDQTGWVQFGEVLHIADKAIKEGLATSMIIVMPDANTGQRGYYNSPKGDWRYEDFFFEEFMPYIENEYRIKGEKRYRAVAGLSMGGIATYIYVLHRPALFSSACPLSAGEDIKDVQRLKKLSLTKGTTVADQEAYFRRYSVLSQIDRLPDNQKKTVRWYIDSGDDDDEGACLVHIAMLNKEIPHEFRVRDGAHNWTYWRSALPQVLDFVSQSFRK